MNVRFRGVDQFNCWLWLSFKEIPSEGERNYIDGIFDSWYVLGRLGGFNAENMQAHNQCGDLSWFSYDNDQAKSVIPAVMHNMGQLEYQEKWARCWLDLGTSDPFSLDVLVNVLSQLDADIVQLDELIIGGENEDWPVDEHPDAIFQSYS